MHEAMENRMTFQDYKKLTPEERDYYIFDNICKIGAVCDNLEKMDEKYASKWVQNVMTWLGYLTGASVVAALLALVVGNTNHKP